MEDLTFLTGQQCFGGDVRSDFRSTYENEKLDILKKRGVRAALTDFSILLGAYIPAEEDLFIKFDPDIKKDYYLKEDYSLQGRIGDYWTRPTDEYELNRWYESDFDSWCASYAEDSAFGRLEHTPCLRDVGARPAIIFSTMEAIPTNGVKPKKADDGVIEVEYGYYPQQAASKEMQEILEKNYKRRTIARTGNKYTTDSIIGEEYKQRRLTGEPKKYRKTFLPREHQEFQFDGKRYVRVEVNARAGRATLSNGEIYETGDFAWIEVSPVKWLVDEKEKTMTTDKILFAGVQFHNEDKGHSIDFDRTNIKKFMDKYLSKELEQITREKHRRKSRLEKLNPDTIDELDRVIITDTERINDWIESGESVLLRGPSGIGKQKGLKNHIQMQFI